MKSLRSYALLIAGAFLPATLVVLIFNTGEEPTLPLPCREVLRSVFDSYFTMQKMLANDNAAGALAARMRLEWSTAELDAVEFPAKNDYRAAKWREVRSYLQGIPSYGKGDNIASLRADFAYLSDVMINVVQMVGHGHPMPLYAFYCPMAFGNTGGAWLQDNNQISNPYFGKEMLECGRLDGTFPPGK